MKVELDSKQSFLDEAKLEEIPHYLTVRERGVGQETLEFRFVTPEVANQRWKLEEDMVNSLDAITKKAKGQEQARYGEILSLIRFHYLFPPWGQMRGTRRFHVAFSQPNSGQPANTWYEIAKGSGINKVMDLIKYATKRERVLGSPNELLKKAVYEKPTLQIPFSRESYHKFRDDFMKWWQLLDRQFVEVLIPKLIAGKDDPLLSHMRHVDPNGYKRARKSTKVAQEFVFRRYFKDELKNQDELAKVYSALLDKAISLSQKYVARAREGKGSLSSSGFPNGFDSVMTEFVAQVEKDKKRDKVLRVGKDRITIMDMSTYLDSLRKSIRSSDVVIKWSALVEMIEAVTYKGNAIRLIQREAEAAYLTLLHHVITHIYRKIRKELTVAEKRAFILAHFRQYNCLGRKSPVLPFGGRIPVRERAIWDFFEETGERVKGLVYSALIFKSHFSVEDRRRFTRELKDCWNRHLLFYPSWDYLTPEDERVAKYHQRAKERTKSLETPVSKDEEVNPVTLGETIAAPKEPDNELDYLLEKHCTPRQAKVLRLQCEGYVEREIAEVIGREQGKTISQQAISKIITMARRRIVEGEGKRN